MYKHLHDDWTSSAAVTAAAMPSDSVEVVPAPSPAHATGGLSDDSRRVDVGHGGGCGIASDSYPPQESAGSGPGVLSISVPDEDRTHATFLDLDVSELDLSRLFSIPPCADSEDNLALLLSLA